MPDKNVKLPATRVSEHDRMRIALSSERAVRLQLQHEAAVKHANDLREQRQKHADAHNETTASLRKTYALADGDTIDLETGTITRAPAAEQPSES